MAYEENEYLQLSGLQHFVFCRRQWAMIHVEKQWAENVRTVEGHHFHKRAHDSHFRERRGNVLILRGISCFSAELGVSGQCDVLEMHKVEEPEETSDVKDYGRNGIPVNGLEGLWIPFPVEYKKGESKIIDADRLQLCCQAMCLEEMLCTDVPEGALFYGESRRREKVIFTPELCNRVRSCLEEMHRYYGRGYTPKAKPSKSCNACSLKDLCLPKLVKTKTVASYIKEALQEETVYDYSEKIPNDLANQITEGMEQSE